MNLAHALALRARMTAAARARRKPRQPPAAAPPRGLVVGFGKFVRDLGRQMDADTEALVLPALVHLGLRSDGPTDVVTSLGSALRSALSKRVRSHVVLHTLDDLASRVSTWSGGQLDRQVRAVMGIDLPASSPQLAETIRLFRHQCVQQITKIADDKAHRIERILAHGAQRGARHEDIADEIAADKSISPERAALIARDQVLQLNASVTQARHEAAGITHYTWNTSHDERVRPDHAALEGKVFAYSDPPVCDRRTGYKANPGQSINCRCIGTPVLDGID